MRLRRSPRCFPTFTSARRMTSGEAVFGAAAALASPPPGSLPASLPAVPARASEAWGGRRRRRGRRGGAGRGERGGAGRRERGGTGRRKRCGTGRGERCGTGRRERGGAGRRERGAGSRRGARPRAAGSRWGRGSAGARTRSTACTRSRRPGSMAMTRVLSTSNSSDASRARLRTSRVFSLLVTTGSARIGPSRCLSGRTFDLRNRRDAATPSVLTKKSKHRSRRPRLRNGASLKTDRQRASLALRRLYRLRSRTWNSFFRDSTPHSDAPKPSSKNVLASMRTWHMPIRAWGKRVKRRTRRRRAPARLRNSSDS